MTKYKMMAAAVAMMASASVASAQCSAGTTQDACQKTVDLVNYITPQFATALAGGSATLGQGGTHAGLGHFALDLRATGVFGSMPKLSGVTFSPSGSQTSTLTSAAQVVPGLTAGASIGLFRGLPLGVTHIGGVDALISATYLPNVNGNGVAVKVSGSNFKFGFGVRIGLLEESLVAPGVGLTILKRDLPTVSITGTSANGSFAVKDYTVGATSWRLTASKSLLLFNLYGGLGQDMYSSSSTIAVTATNSGITTSSTSANSMKMTRMNLFVGTSLNLLVVKLTAELGQVNGGSAPAFKNTFEAATTKARNYASLGVRFAL